MTENVQPKVLRESMTVLDRVVEDLCREKIGNLPLEDMKSAILESANRYIKETYGSVEKRVKVTTDDGRSIQLTGVLHEKFEEVLAYVREGEPVFLCGGAGTGKNVICYQVAQTLGLTFYFSNAVTQEHKLTGFVDAMGRYQETQFFKAFTKGGLFMLDEMDASCPEALIVLNAAIANGYFDFPTGERITAHKDFRVVGAGNTYGHGASYQYVGRNQLDGATLDRFATVMIDYDKKIEDAMAMGNQELLDFVRDFRNACGKGGIPAIVSYRAIKRLSKMEPHIGTEETVRSGLTKNLEKGDLDMIVKNMSVNNKYMKALKQVQGSAK